MSKAKQLKQDQALHWSAYRKCLVLHDFNNLIWRIKCGQN
jgi:hypothetical protein